MKKHLFLLLLALVGSSISLLAGSFVGFESTSTNKLSTQIHSGGLVQNMNNISLIETSTAPYKYNINLINGGTGTFTMGGITFSYTNSEAGKTAYKTYDNYIQPNGVDREITIPTVNGEQVKIVLIESCAGILINGVSYDFVGGDNIITATGSSIVLKNSSAKPKISAILSLNAGPILQKIGDLYYYLDVANNTAEVTSQNSSYPYWSTHIVTANIPFSVTYNANTYIVTSIGKNAFDGCSDLTYVTIPNSVTSIGDDAFKGCSSLTSVTIPNSVTSIGNGAFSNCHGLTSVVIGSSVTSIGNDAFYGCSSLTSVLLNSNAIASEQYYINFSLNNIFGDQVSEFTMGNSVTSIGENAFRNCSGLTSVTIPNSVKSIGDQAFYGCNVSALNFIGNIEDWLNKAWSPAFISGNYQLLLNGVLQKNVTIPNNFTNINDNAFAGCSSLTLVKIPNSITNIGSYAFYGCSGLISVTIPNSVTSIGNQAFWQCSSLTKVTITDIAAWCNINFDREGSNPLYYAKHLYVNDAEITDLVIPNGVTNIGTWAFDGCSGLKSVTIPNSVTSIGEGAFNGCSSLTKVNIADIAAWCNITFSNESSNPLFNVARLCVDDVTVTNMVIPNSVTSIKNNAFFGCSSLISVTIPNSVTSIGEQAFCSCANLTSITIPNSVKNIGFFAFNSCVSLTSVTIPNSVTSIEYCAFYLCIRLTSVTIPNSVASIGYGAFYGCGSLTSVTIPSSVTSIGDQAFSYCGSLALIYNYTTSPQMIDSGVFGGEGEWEVEGVKLRPVDKGTCKLYVPGESLALYKTADVWKEFSNILPIPQTEGVENVATISTNAQSTKVVRDGQIFILRGDKTYTLTGAEVK